MESTQNGTCFAVFSQRLAGMLMVKGFVLVEIADNYNQSGRHVFYFKDSELLRSLVKEFTINKKI